MFSGFIYDGMGWRWVLYWPAIGCGFGFLILFFLMEETNYDRKTIGVVQFPSSEGSSIKEPASDAEKGDIVPLPTSITSIADSIAYKKKTFLQKLSILDRPRPNQLLIMVILLL